MSDKADNDRRDGNGEHDREHGNAGNAGNGERPSAADLLPGEEPPMPATPPRVPPAGPVGGERPWVREEQDERTEEKRKPGDGEGPEPRR